MELRCKSAYVDNSFREGVYLTVDQESGRITRVADTPSGDPALSELDGFVMPGCVNTHAHMGMSIFNELYNSLNQKTAIDKAKGLEWLAKVWSYEPLLTREDVYAATCMTAYEMLASGTIVAADHYFYPEDIVRAANDCGIRILVSPPIMDTKEKDRYFMNGVNSLTGILEHIQEMSQWRLGLARMAIGAHSIYRLPKSDLETIARFSAETGLPVHMHLGEAGSEDKVLAQCGKTTLEYAAECGLLNERLLIAHGTTLTDYDLLKAVGAKVAWCPFTNARKARGSAKVKDLRAAGVPVGIATDGNISAFSMNLFRHMSYGLTLANMAYGDMKAVSTEDCFNILTSDGAKCLGLEKEIGKLEVGMAADLICVKKPNPSDVVFGTEASDVDFVMVNGIIAKENGKLVNQQHYDWVKGQFKNSVQRLESVIANGQ